MTDRNFDSLIVDVVDDCLSDLLGGRTAQVFNSHLNPVLLSRDPENYLSSLRSVVGESATRAIERRIEGLLSERLGTSTPASSVKLADFIQSSRNTFATGH